MSYSPELSPIDYSEEELEEQKPLPTIKLKLKLNPLPVPEKKKKHKKKHKKNKHKKSKHEDEVATTPQVHVGGKRPFALLQQQQQLPPQHYIEEEEEEEEEYYESEQEEESYHPTDTSTKRPKYKHHEEYDKHHQDDSQKRRNSSMNGEKPKKRGRPTNKAKQAALIAALPPKIPESLQKKDLKSVLTKLLDNIQKKDAYGFFLEPVNPKFVPDYLKIIKTPMDFSTMRKKLDTYKSIDEFKIDFNLIIANAKLYNSIETIYWKSADKISEFGSKLIEKAEKQIIEEKITAIQPTQPRLSISVGNNQRLSFSNIKEEDVDIMGIDASMPILRKQDLTRETSVDSNAITPITSLQPFKKKKKKVADTGVLYAPDGALHTVGGLNDLRTLIPTDTLFNDPPQLTTSNPAALPSAFFLNRHDDFTYNKHFVHNAHFNDYGPFTTLGAQTPGAFYTPQDASYIYPLYGDDRGEAYLKSLWNFVDEDQEMQAQVEEKANYLTRGAWKVVEAVLQKKNDPEGDIEPVKTEFGLVDVAAIVDDQIKA